MQQQLRELGYTDSKGRALADDADCGPQTRAAVTAFQLDHGLTPNGVASVETKQAIEQAVQQQAQQQASSQQHSMFYDLPSSAPTAPLSLADSAHNGHTLFCQGFSCIEQLNARQGVANDSVRDANATGALVVEAVARLYAHRRRGCEPRCLSPHRDAGKRGSSQVRHGGHDAGDLDTAATKQRPMGLGGATQREALDRAAGATAGGVVAVAGSRSCALTMNAQGCERSAGDMPSSDRRQLGHTFRVKT